MNTQSTDSPPKVRCTDVISDTLRGYAGVREADLDLRTGRLKIVYDPRVIDRGQALSLVRRAGERAWAQVQRCALANTPACADCAAGLSQELAAHFQALAQGALPPAEFRDGHIEVRLPLAETHFQEVAEAQVAPPPERALRPPFWERWHLTSARAQAALTVVTLLALLLAAFGARLGLPAWGITSLYVLAYLAGGLFGFIESIEALKEGEFNVDLLMILAALGAAFIGQPNEGAILLFLFSLSNALQEYALGRNRQAIEKLLELRPPVALVQEGDQWVERPVEDLRLEDVVLVRPGERFPIDGEVLQGETEVDQSPITGESVPVPKHPGDPVFAGTVNTTGAVEVRVTHLAQDTTLAKIVQLVEEAQSAKAKTQRMLDDFEQVYAKLVLAGAVLLVVVPLLFFHTPFERAFYRAMTWLVVASPCALVISTPASILSAIANGARHGVLFKGGAYLEQTALIKVVAFDKTGTLTEGEPRVTGIYPQPGQDEADFLRRVAAIEARSEHPIARAIVHEAQQRGLALPEAEDFRALVGQGVEGRVDGHLIWVGNERLFRERDVELPPALNQALHELENQGQTAMLAYDATARAWLGLLAVADTVRADAAQVVARLKELGVERVVMLTGDNERVAAAIARQVGVDEYYAQLLPKDKVQALEHLRRQYGVTAMVGDGVNDAPALAAADVGIAMGGAGTDVALETADVVLMADNLSHLPYAIGLARRARRIVWQNLTFSLAVIVMLVALAFGADLPLPLGVVGHEGSTVLVVLNGLRLLAYRG